MAVPLLTSKHTNTYKIQLSGYSPAVAPEAILPLQQLHWLLVQYRNSSWRKALNNLPHRHSPTHHLWSADSNLLRPITRTKHPTLGNWAFAPTAPTLWKLPQHIRNSESLQAFKSLMKTHLFKLAFKFDVSLLLKTNKRKKPIPKKDIVLSFHFNYFVLFVFVKCQIYSTM